MIRTTILCFLIIASLFCQGQDFVYEGGKSTFKGNKFDLRSFSRHGSKVMDSIIILDPVTGEKIIKRFEALRPVSMNGKTIFPADSVLSPDENKRTRRSIEKYIIDKLTNGKTLKSLHDGTVRIDQFSYLVIDEHGKIVHYNDYSPYLIGPDGNMRALDIFSEMDSILTAYPPIKFSTLKKQKTIVLLNISLSQYLLKINNHEITISE